MKRPSMHFKYLELGRDSVAAGFSWGKRPEFPMGEKFPLRQQSVQYTKYKYKYNWRPWHLKLKLSLSPKGGLHGRSCHPIWDVSRCIRAELHETGGLSATLAVNRLGRCHAARPRAMQGSVLLNSEPFPCIALRTS